MIIAAKFPNYMTGAFFFLLHFAPLSWEQNILTCRSVTLGVNSKQGFPGLIYYAPDPEQKIGGEGHIGQAELLQWQEKCKLQIRSELCWGRRSAFKPVLFLVWLWLFIAHHFSVGAADLTWWRRSVFTNFCILGHWMHFEVDCSQRNFVVL